MRVSRSGESFPMHIAYDATVNGLEASRAGRRVRDRRGRALSMGLSSYLLGFHEETGLD